MTSATAPAKLNLTLEVLRKRPDGFHEIRSVVQTIDFYDTLNFSASPSVSYRCSLAGWSPAKSLVSRAVSLLQNSTGVRQGVLIEIEKRIPLSSGLGGDSSNAAAVLRGLNLLWNLKLSLRDLLAYGAQLGSDVPLFLYGGTVLAEGRGEVIRPLRPMPRMNVILLLPALVRPDNKTQQLYSRLTPRQYTTGKITEAFANMLEGKAAGQSTGLFNVFDDAGLSFFSGLKELKQEFLQAGAAEVHLAGSGPVLFTLLRDEIKTGDIVRRLQKKGLEVYRCGFLLAGATTRRREDF
ncbi:MAG: 4-(cytidine 5'-diphospho)-2-C-methyl-D-erythritol kinase [Dehalococcoidales bacterium]|nr:4-(cytidine 5'-diphospho)-2-C-methyl-D-erythritol kinase [Dehalococcoidales bacterium]